jgi:hypothetical protein
VHHLVESRRQRDLVGCDWCVAEVSSLKESGVADDFVIRGGGLGAQPNSELRVLGK